MFISIFESITLQHKISLNLLLFVKGSKQTAITSKIPATKRSMERFLFRVKALLHSTSSGCTFWMGMEVL
jgi:hypothetical protein